MKSDLPQLDVEVIKEPPMTETGKVAAPPSRRASRRSLMWFFVLLAAAVVAAIVLGLRPRVEREKMLAADAEAEAARRPSVNVMAAHQSPSQSRLELPGDLQALVESPIFARANGYLRRRLADIGDHVQKGQTLVEIDTPELDQQISQARATQAQSEAALQQTRAALVQARAHLKFADITLTRWKHLTERGVVSRQEGDEKQAEFEIARAQVETSQANIAAAQKTVDANAANLKRLEELKSFATITAPFEGRITARNQNIDPGTLINAGNGGPGQEIFRIAQIRTMRVFVNVPQTYAPLVHGGQTAELRVQELPGRVFTATVSRATNAVDTSSRTMLAILETPNPSGALLPGMYAQVRFSFAGDASNVLIAGDALMLGREGPRVAVVGTDHIVHMRQIHIVHDFGSELEVDSGVAPGELVVMNPNDRVRENAQVDIRSSK